MLHLRFMSLLALLLGASLGAALPRNPPASLQTCNLSKYQFLVPHEREAVLQLKKQFEEDIMMLSDRTCHTLLFHRSTRKWNTAELSVPDRVMLVEAELDLATAMLQLPTDMLGLPTIPKFTKMRQQPLAFFTQAREDLRGCMATEAPSHQPSRKLRQWLQKLQMAMKTETMGCLEASAILHLFQMLNDLQCAALQEECT